MTKLSVLKSVIILFLILILCASFFAGRVYAENAIPDPVPFPCDETDDPEYASGRPYQGSVCGDRPITYWCGNDIVVSLGSVSVPYCDPGSGQATTCPCTGSRCDRTGANKQKIDIDLTNVELPILGNTELTGNSQNAEDSMDDGTKVSNYVAWYLGGTNTKAEYGATDPTTKEGVSRIVDTSGPLKKLLPSTIQDATRLNTINSASLEVTYIPDGEGPPIEVLDPVTEPENHDQIVVCANKDGSGLFNWALDLLSLGKYTPAECYTEGGSKAKGDKVLRLKDWGENKLVFNIITNQVVGLSINILKLLYPSVPAGAIEKSIGDHWTYAKPPLPWDDGTGKSFASDIEYQKAYKEWRGNACVIIPIINKLVCIGNVFVPSIYSEMYPFVPLANTSDKQGSHLVTNTHLTITRAEFECPSEGCYQIWHSAGLKLPHSAESYQLSQSLKSTYLPATESGSVKVGLYPGATTPNDVENNSTCRIIPSRTNPGDDVVFDNHKSHIEVDVQYKITEIKCTNPKYIFSDNLGIWKWDADCSSEIYATINTVSKTAYANEIWSNTVAGSDSIFRRIYPKTGVGAPVSCIADTPASSNVTYTLSGNSTSGLSLLRVIEPDKSIVSGGEDADSIDAQLYYPHYGGVLDYFLNGIQQALRPKEFGTGTPENGQYCSNIACGELPDLPKAAGACKMGSNRVLSTPQALNDIVEAAAETYKVPPTLILGVMYGEGAFNPGRYHWTDTNVKNWATCQRIPNCTPGGNIINSVVPFIGPYWENLAVKILPDLQKIDPAKQVTDPCNLLDAIYGLAKDLHDNAGGSAALTGKTCFGVTMSSTNPTSCDWSPSQYETSIRVWEFGTAYNSTYTCATKENSCATGGGADAACPGGDNCETINNRYPNPSHNACVWNIATSGGTGGGP